MSPLHEYLTLTLSILSLLGLQPFRPPVQYNQLGSLPQRFVNLSLSHGLEEKGASFHGYGAELHYNNQFLKPAQLQVNNEPKNLNRVFLLSLSCMYLFIYFYSWSVFSRLLLFPSFQ